MNAKDRKEIEGLKAVLEKVQAELENDVQSQLQTLSDDEREKFDNMSEGLQNGERGQKIQAAADALESAVSTLDEIMLSIDEVKSHLDGALE